MKNIGYIIVFIISTSGFSQNTLSEVLKTYNSETVPYITVQELAMPKTKALILDARERNEYKISHLKGAIFVGYNDFKVDVFEKIHPNKNEVIVVYCSLGIRSESIAEKLKNSGYTNVQNLYGGIFEWKNNGYPIFNSIGKETDSIHAYSKEWSKWAKKGIKVFN